VEEEEAATLPKQAAMELTGAAAATDLHQTGVTVIIHILKILEEDGA
jgi:hypothetical protein